MIPPHFVLDSSQWSFDGLSGEEVNALLESLAERWQTAEARDEVVAIGGDDFARAVDGDRGFWELFGPGRFTLTREVSEAFAALASRPKTSAGQC
jgi:hypothetical protein